MTSEERLGKLAAGLGALREALLLEARDAQRSGNMGECLRKERAARLVWRWQTGAFAARLSRSPYP